MSGPAGTPEPPLRIVVADDQASVREGLAAMLGMLPGIEVVAVAADGEQAVEAVADWHPDTILLDLRMPVLDGVEATRRLAEQHPGVAVVVLTTYDDDASVLSALRAGARSYITKDESVRKFVQGGGSTNPHPLCPLRAVSRLVGSARSARRLSGSARVAGQTTFIAAEELLGSR